MIQPQERIELGDKTDEKPEDENHEKHLAEDMQWVSWRQTTSALTGRERSPCTKPILFDESLSPLQLTERMARAMRKRWRTIIMKGRSDSTPSEARH